MNSRAKEDESAVNEKIEVFKTSITNKFNGIIDDFTKNLAIESDLSSKTCVDLSKLGTKLIKTMTVIIMQHIFTLSAELSILSFLKKTSKPN